MAQIEPPPRTVQKFNSLWKEWLSRLYTFVFDHTGGSTPTSPATGTSWNAHGNTATGEANTPLKIDAGTLWAEGGTGNAPTSVASTVGTRFMWIPSKGSIRAGTLTEAGKARWDAANIGSESLAIGLSPMASGNYSIALGNAAQATALNAVAIGNNSTASGSSGTAIGNGCTAASTALAAGNNSLVNSSTSLGLGGSCTVGTTSGSILFGTAVGFNASCEMDGAAPGFSTFPLALGAYCQAKGNGSIVIGTGVGASNKFVNDIDQSLMLGANIDTVVAGTKPTIFLKNKQCGIEQTSPQSTLDIGGSVGFQHDEILAVSGSTTTLDADDNQYTFRIDIKNLTSGQFHTIVLPEISTIPRRIFYFKVVDTDATDVPGRSPGYVKIRADSGGNKIEYRGTGTSALGYAGTDGSGASIDINIGDAVTIIANEDDSTWWII